MRIMGEKLIEPGTKKKAVETHGNEGEKYSPIRMTLTATV